MKTKKKVPIKKIKKSQTRKKHIRFEYGELVASGGKILICMNNSLRGKSVAVEEVSMALSMFRRCIEDQEPGVTVYTDLAASIWEKRNGAK